MGLDITIKSTSPVLCPHCGEVVQHGVVAEEDSSGRVWYDLLEEFGYYVPYDQRTEENDWYAKDMTLTEDQTKQLYRFVKARPTIYNGAAICALIAESGFLDGGQVAINAGW